jgi:hypothetical protein
MRRWCWLVVCLAGVSGLWADGVPQGHVKFVCQPNGWGRTPEEAVRDLRERILPWYEKNYGDRPGFGIDRGYAAVVEVSRGRQWQADGRLWWYVPRAVQPAGGKGPARGR